jgi:hypothetical protein
MALPEVLDVLAWLEDWWGGLASDPGFYGMTAERYGDVVRALDRARSFIEACEPDEDDPRRFPVVTGCGDDDHQDLADRVAEQLRRRGYQQVAVEVTEWVGYEVDPGEGRWLDPVYVVASHWNGTEREELHDATCDLGAAPHDEQTAFVVDQLVNG